MACNVIIVRETRDCDNPEDGGSWFRGLPVDVLRYDKSFFGDRVTPVLDDSFMVLTISDADYDDTHATLTEQYEDDASGEYLIRAFRVYIEEFPAIILAQLEQTGFAEMTYAQASPYIRHRITGECW